jgi:hypothetical protein
MLSHTSNLSARKSEHPGLFIDLLSPRDTIDQVETTLKNKLFRLNPETGAVEMQGDVTDEMYGLDH